MSTTIIIRLIVTIATVSLVHGFALPFEGLYELDIIHYNDFHARFEETSVETPTCRFNNGSCLGGFPRLYSEIMELRRQKPKSLLLNAGDSFQGTYWYTLLKWNITQEFMNLLPHDAHAVGNHEFDDGPKGLAHYFAALKAPVVAANMDASKEPSLQGLFKPHVIVKRDGRKIGIIGLITTDTKTLSSPGNVVFTDPMEATEREAEALTEKGVDIIIVLSHCGLEIDKQIARKHGKHIDIIVGGHSHSLLWNGDSPSGEEVAGPYPVFIETSDDKEHKVVIVQASAFTKYLGNLTVYFDYLGRYVKWEGGPIFLNRSIPEDPKIKQKLAPYAKIVHKAENVPVGQSATTLRFEDCVFGECALGDLLVDAFNDYAKAKVTTENSHLAFIQRGNIKSSIPSGHPKIKQKLAPYAKIVHKAENVPVGQSATTLRFEDCVFGECALGDLLVDAFNDYAKAKVTTENSHLAFIQRGNIKSSIPSGQITKGTIFELLPFNDRIETFELQGKYVREALERSVSDAWAYSPFKGPWVLQVSGLQVKYNISQPEGHRVIEVNVGSSKSNTALNDEQFYQVTAPTYLADGGDGFQMFKNGKTNVKIIGRDEQILELYLKENSPINITTDGRIEIIQ